MLDHPRAYLLEVVGKIELADRTCAFARPQRLVGLGDGHAQHSIAVCFGRSSLLRARVGHRASRSPRKRSVFGRCRPLRLAVSVGMPDRARVGCFANTRHEGLRPLASACGDRLHAATRRDRSVLVEDRGTVAFDCELVAMLDQEPVVALAAIAIVAHAHQHPAAPQLGARKNELELTPAQCFAGVTVPVRHPEAAVPQHDRPAAVLTLGDRAFEVSVLERMVLDLDGEALVAWIERGPLGDGPGFEHAIQLQPQVIVQAGCSMLLHHKARVVCRLGGAFSGRFGRLHEVALGAIKRKFLPHGNPRLEPKLGRPPCNGARRKSFPSPLRACPTIDQSV